MAGVIVVHAVHEAVVEALYRVSPPGAVVRALDLERFAVQSSGALLGVAGVDGNDSTTIGRLSQLHQSVPLWPLLVVAPLTPQAVSSLHAAGLLHGLRGGRSRTAARPRPRRAPWRRSHAHGSAAHGPGG